jgi:phosphatidate cytidylyltransferase
VSGATAESTPPDRLPPRGLAAPGFLPNLARRVGTALVALPALLALLLLGSAWLVIGVVALALALGLLEFFSLLGARGISPMRWVGLCFAAILFIDVVSPGRPGVALAPIGALLLLVATLRRGLDRDSVSAAACTLLGAVYLGALGGTIAALRLLPPAGEGGWRIVLLLVVVVFSDSFAFFVGHAAGRHRLAPAVSPGKSVEGALAGVVGGVLGALAVRRLGLPDVPGLDAVLLGAAVAVLGIVGDLDESLLKRWAGVKDSGTLFPGHGGMLDRLDSLLFGAPVLYYYFQYVR